jgi:hypothetical protein
MDKEFVLHNAASDITTYRKVKDMIARLGCSADTKIYIKDNDIKLVVYSQSNIDAIRGALIERKICSTYAEIGD